MKLIDRYIISTVLGMTMLMFLVFLGLQLLIGLLSEMNQFGQGAYSIVHSIKFILLMLPLNMYNLFPSIALLGTLLGLGVLASSNELTVMRISGMSIVRLIIAVLWAGLILILFVTFIGEFIAPPMALLAEKNKIYAKSNGQIFNTESGIWTRQDNTFIHINVNYAGNHLTGITRYELNKQFQLISISHATSGDFIAGEWQMKDITTSHITAKRVTVSTKPDAIWNINVAFSSLNKVAPAQMSLPVLYRQATFRLVNGLNVENFLLSFWARIFQPLNTLIMMLLAIPFIFGPLHSVTAGLRLLSGVMIGLGFFVFNRFFEPFSLVYELSPILAAVIPTGIFALLAIFLLVRNR